MSDDSQRPIIVKRVKKNAHGHHGGAWKIAYADFVTAMMAFFLLMWLLGSTTRADLQGIAEYFQTPLKIALMGGSGAGDSTSVIKGGGKDLTRADGQQKHGDSTAGRKVTQNDLEQELARRERLMLQQLKAKVEAAIAANPTLSQFRNQLLIDITTEGLRIQIVDEQNRPMFAIGSANLQPYTHDIVREIGKLINDIPNRISLSGHTDASSYFSGERGYSNWELSADRSNAVRRELLAGGMQESRIARVVGLASSVLLDPQDPYNPINRRVSIIVMNKKAEEAASKDGGTIEVADPDDLKLPADGGASSRSSVTPAAPVAGAAQGGEGQNHAIQPSR
ncbi:MAG TPA: flagellar motor protein MotB [Burkholderiales bacterium]|nr:flagellar motor protein MotB [Burkholderiales bacterium]